MFIGRDWKRAMIQFHSSAPPFSHPLPITPMFIPVGMNQIQNFVSIETPPEKVCDPLNMFAFLLSNMKRLLVVYWSTLHCSPSSSIAPIAVLLPLALAPLSRRLFATRGKLVSDQSRYEPCRRESGMRACATGPRSMESRATQRGFRNAWQRSSSTPLSPITKI